jgi:hypothetical protein
LSSGKHQSGDAFMALPVGGAIEAGEQLRPRDQRRSGIVHRLAQCDLVAIDQPTVADPDLAAESVRRGCRRRRAGDLRAGRCAPAKPMPVMSMAMMSAQAPIDRCPMSVRPIIYAGTRVAINSASCGSSQCSKDTVPSPPATIE